MKHMTSHNECIIHYEEIEFIGWFLSFFAMNMAHTYLLNVETMVDEIVFPAMLNAMARKLEASHVAQYCLATGENRLFCK